MANHTSNSSSAPKRQASDLPFGSEFSPSQIELPVLLEFSKEHGGNWKAFEAAVKNKYFSQNATNDYNRGKLANNTKLGMIAYGLIDRHARLTEFGEKLYTLQGQPDKLHAELARHILLNLHGMTLVQCLQDIQSAGETVDLVKLRDWLEERGIHFPRGGKHPSMMRLWLEKAGVFTTGWRVNAAKLQELVGAGTEEIETLASLSAEQRAFLKTLANVAVVVSTGEIGASARGYANKIMSDTNLCLVLVNGDDLLAIERNPAAIVDVFNREAVHAMQLRLLEL